MDSLGLVRPAAAAQATAATAVKSRETEKTSSGRARPAPLKLCSARATPALSPSRATGSAPRPATAFKLISPATRSLALAALQAAALTLVILVFGSCVAVAATASVDSDSDSDSGSAQSILESFQFNSLVLVDEAAEAPKPPGAGDPASPHASNLTALLAALYPGSGSGTGAGSGGLNGSLLGPPSLGAGGTSAATAALGELLDGPLNASEPATTTAPEGPEAEPEYALPPLHAIAVSVVLLFVILGTVVGNVLVCIAVCMVRKLRRPCNYLLVSLALSDLCVAVLVMPMALLYEVLEKWAFGPLLCDIWVSFDVLCCTASILNLCAISVDRYLAITKPLEYGVKRTPRRMMLCVALVWLAAACISLPPLLILGNEHQDEHGEPICAVCQNFAYQIYATLGSFYIPLAVMLFVYYQIFRAARRIVLEEKRAQTHLQHALNGAASAPQPPPPAPATGVTDLSSGNGLRHSSCGNTSLTYSTCGGGGGHGAGGSGSSGLLGSPHHKKLRFQLAKEKKASTTLGIIMSAFTVCWLPFFILALIRPFVESETTHVPQTLSSLFLWLGYANSLLNPIIYATLNRDFRKPFQEILYFRCSSLNTMMRENYYQDQYGEPPSQRVMLGDERQGARESFL